LLYIYTEKSLFFLISISNKIEKKYHLNVSLKIE